MKKNLKTLAIVIAVLFLYYFSVSALKSSENTHTNIANYTRDTFTNCILNSEYTEVTNFWGRPELQVTNQFTRYKELNFNSIHQYDAMGSVRYGMPYDTLSQTQIDNFKGVLDSVKDENLYGYLERSFLSKYCYGQRLIYEVSNIPNDVTTNYGFVYRHNMEETYTTDSGRTVLHAVPEMNNQGYLCKDIYENLHHSDLLNFRQNDKGWWYIKPVMRIPVNTHDTTKVIKIEVIPFGDTNAIKTIIIRAENFTDSNYNYYGNYIENYLWLYPPLKISGDTNSTSLNYGHNEDSLWNGQCKVDFRVYWFGECEVWFDKMIVDDEWANELFDPEYQSDINKRIEQEVTSFTDNLYSFFMDEVLISQVPCIKYIMDKMRYYKPESRLSFALTNYLHIRGLKNDNLSYQIYFDSLHPQILQADHHGLGVYENWVNLAIPNVFPYYDSLLTNPLWFTDAGTYNRKLQNDVLGWKGEVVPLNQTGSLVYEINKKCD